MNLLPLLSLLSPCFGSTSAQLTRPNNVVTVSEGEDALLPCTLGSGQSIDKFDWRKDNGEEEKKEVFFYDRGSYYGNGLRGQNEQFTGRVLFFQHERTSGNASIKIQNTRLEDTGTYTCVLFEPHRQELNLRLNVVGDLKIRSIAGAAREPWIKPIHEKSTWSLLECKVEGVPKPDVQWTTSTGQTLSAIKLAAPVNQDRQFLVKLQVNVTRSDNYTCVATQRDIYHQINNTLEVHLQNLDFVTVSGGEDTVLPCSLDSKQNIQGMAFSWSKDDTKVLFYDGGRVEENELFTGRLTLFQPELKSGNASIKIHNTETTDSGHYTCYFPDIQKTHVILHVVDAERQTGWIVAVVTLAIAVGALLIMIVKQRCSKGPNQLKQEKVHLNSTSIPGLNEDCGGKCDM